MFRGMLITGSLAVEVFYVKFLHVKVFYWGILFFWGVVEVR